MFELLDSIRRNFDMILQISVAQQYVDDLYKLEVMIDKEMEEDRSQDMLIPQQTSSGLPFYSKIVGSNTPPWNTIIDEFKMLIQMNLWAIPLSRNILSLHS